MQVRKKGVAGGCHVRHHSARVQAVYLFDLYSGTDTVLELFI